MFPAGIPRGRIDCTLVSKSDIVAVGYVRGNEFDDLMHI